MRKDETSFAYFTLSVLRKSQLIIFSSSSVIHQNPDCLRENKCRRRLIINFENIKILIDYTLKFILNVSPPKPW
jgi:hypothetical protein